MWRFPGSVQIRQNPTPLSLGLAHFCHQNRETGNSIRMSPYATYQCATRRQARPGKKGCRKGGKTVRAREQARSHRCTGRIAKRYDIGITCFGGVAIGSRRPPTSSAGFCGTQIQDSVVSYAVKFCDSSGTDRKESGGRLHPLILSYLSLRSYSRCSGQTTSCRSRS